MHAADERIPRRLPCGDAAISVEFDTVIDPALNARVLALDAALLAQPSAGLRETVPTYCSLFDPLACDIPALKRTLLELPHAPSPGPRRRGAGMCRSFMAANSAWTWTIWPSAMA